MPLAARALGPASGSRDRRSSAAAAIASSSSRSSSAAAPASRGRTASPRAAQPATAPRWVATARRRAPAACLARQPRQRAWSRVAAAAARHASAARLAIKPRQRAWSRVAAPLRRLAASCSHHTLEESFWAARALCQPLQRRGPAVHQEPHTAGVGGSPRPGCTRRPAGASGRTAGTRAAAAARPRCGSLPARRRLPSAPRRRSWPSRPGAARPVPGSAPAGPPTGPAAALCTSCTVDVPTSFTAAGASPATPAFAGPSSTGAQRAAGQHQAPHQH
mmetsp:Transcript_41047/g.127174  ORF Transcript_41047/g.127174 Transcript_41047/m.127174 type:complete len:276 (-) Transcript_41047:301-1128(-)